MNKVIVLRGVSGSGKSTWAQHFCMQDDHTSRVTIILSADDFFCRSGEYKFDASKLAEAHADCLKRFVAYVQNPPSRGWPGLPPEKVSQTIIVDNTNCSMAEMAPYVALGQAYGHDVEVVTIDVVQTSPIVDRNIHQVPRSAVLRQLRILGNQDELIPAWWKHTRILAAT